MTLGFDPIGPNGLPKLRQTDMPPGFEAILGAIRVDRLAAYVSGVRKRLEPWVPETHLEVTLGPGFFTEHSVFYTLVFAEDVKWIIKVPAIGTPDRFTDDDADALRAEACTMRMVRRDVRIPVPAVYDFSETCDHELNCPFILMEYIAGVPLSELWFDLEASPETLDQYRFARGGALSFDIHTHPLEIGPLRGVNPDILRRRLVGQKPAHQPGGGHQYGPMTTTQSYYTFLLNEREVPSGGPLRGAHELLRMLFSLIPEPLNGEKDPFVLSHSKVSPHNILVAPNGAVQGILGWDAAAVVPRNVGNHAYPGWLIRDILSPPNDLDEEDPMRVPPPGESPETLRYYRTIYAHQIEAHRAGRVPLSLTRTSIVYDALMAAATTTRYPNMLVLEKIMELVVKAIRDVVLPHKWEQVGEVAADVDLERLDFWTLCGRWAEGQTTQQDLELVEKGFLVMVRGEDIL